MRRFDCRNNTFHLCKIFKCIYCFIIRNRHIFGSADIMQIRVFRTYPGIIQAGGNGINRSDLTVLILAKVRLHSMKNTKSSGCNRGCCFQCINAPSCRFTADQSDILIFNKVIKTADCIGTTAYTGYHRIRQSSFFNKHLIFDFFGDHCLKITHNRRKRMRSHN